MTNNVSEFATGILAIDWPAHGSECNPSHIMLLREYLRRAALWAKELDCTDEWPFFDIAERVDPKIRAEAEADRVEKQLDAWAIMNPVKNTCVAAVHWQALKTQSPQAIPPLPDPYEPLLLLFRRGARFRTEHGFLNVGRGGMPMKTWQEYHRLEPFVVVEESELDRIDQKAKTS